LKPQGNAQGTKRELPDLNFFQFYRKTKAIGASVSIYRIYMLLKRYKILFLTIQEKQQQELGQCSESIA